MKDPAFLFYPNDWLGGTMGMTFEEKGAYMELLMMQFNRGHMTTHMIGQTVGQLWGQIENKFTKDDNGLYFNKRLEDEQIKRKKYSESRRNNITGVNQYTKKHKKERGHTTSHMENENKDINENGELNLNTIKKEKRKKVPLKKEKVEMPWMSKEFIEAWDKWKTYKKAEFRFGFRSIISENTGLRGLANKSENKEKEAIAMIEHAIENGKQGLFPVPKFKNRGEEKVVTYKRPPTIEED